MQRQGCREAEQHLIGPEKIAQLHPLLNMENILAALYNPGEIRSLINVQASNNDLLVHLELSHVIQ